MICYYLKRQEHACRERYIDLAGYGIVVTALLFTHYFSIFVVGVFFLGDLYLFIRKKVSWKVVLSYLMAAVPYAPYMLIIALRRIFSDWGPATSFWPETPTILSLFSVIKTALFDGKLVPFLCFFLAIAVILFKKRFALVAKTVSSDNIYHLMLLTAISLATLVAVYVYSAFVNPQASIFVDRYFISILPMMLIVAAVGMDFALDAFVGARQIDEGYRRLVFLVLFTLLAVSYSEKVFTQIYRAPYTANQPYEQAAEWVYSQEAAHAEDAALLTYGLFGSEGIHYYLSHDGQRPTINTVHFPDFIAQADLPWKTVYRFDGLEPPSQELLNILENYYEMVEKNDSLEIYVYQKK
jgi:hypothetical protein